MSSTDVRSLFLSPESHCAHATRYALRPFARYCLGECVEICALEIGQAKANR